MTVNLSATFYLYFFIAGAVIYLTFLLLLAMQKVKWKKMALIMMLEVYVLLLALPLGIYSHYYQEEYKTRCMVGDPGYYQTCMTKKAETNSHYRVTFQLWRYFVIYGVLVPLVVGMKIKDL